MVTGLAETVPTRYWHALEDGRVQCDVCPRLCKLHEGQLGWPNDKPTDAVAQASVKVRVN